MSSGVIESRSATGHAQATPRLLNLGCGHVSPAGWINVDGSQRAWFASRWHKLDRTLTWMGVLPPTEFSRNTTFANLTRRFPWDDDSIDGVYMGEILEHFTKADGEFVLRECYRVLKPDGVIRIRVPDNARFWTNYLEEYNAIRQRPPSEWNAQHARWVEMFFRDICVCKPKAIGSFGHYHKWMYDEVSLCHALQSVGFHDAERRGLYQSRLPGIEKVEVRDDLIVEAVK